jgi:hypothetical protein
MNQGPHLSLHIPSMYLRITLSESNVIGTRPQGLNLLRRKSLSVKHRRLSAIFFYEVFFPYLLESRVLCGCEKHLVLHRHSQKLHQ